MTPLESTESPSVVVVAAAAALMTLFIASTTARRRLPTALTVMAFLMTFGRLSGLGEVAGLAKLLGGPSLALVLASALTRRTAALRLHPVAWLQPFAAAALVVGVSGALDATMAMIVQAQWLLMTCAAAAVCGCTRTADDFDTVIRALAIGLAGGSLIGLSALLFDPAGSFAAGYGRFTPYECNPNQFGVAFALTVALSMHLLAGSRRVSHSLAWSFVIACGAVGCLLTVSQMAIGLAALGSFPSVARLCRRPLAVTAILLAIGLLAPRLIGNSDGFNLSHIDDARGASRWAWTEAVLEEIRQRPFFGLATAKDAYARDEELNAHNAFVEVAYLAGLVAATPLVAFVGLSLASIPRRLAAAEPSDADVYANRLMAALFVASLVNGLINNLIIYPTYTWAFLHSLIGMRLLSCGARSNRAVRAAETPPLAPQPSWVSA